MFKTTQVKSHTELLPIPDIIEIIFGIPTQIDLTLIKKFTDKICILSAGCIMCS